MQSAASMFQSSRFLGSVRGDLQERIGYTDPPTHISTFTGAGGFDLGLDNAGFETLVAIENDQAAADTYRHNCINGDQLDQDEPPTLLERDIRDISTWEILEAAGIGVGGVTCITGGPPCQGFSHIGDREEDDPRNELYTELVRIVHQAKPVMFVMENVPGLATMKDGQAIMEVCDNFAAGGYHVTWDILNAKHYGVPQDRERIFILGKRVDLLGMPDRGRPQVHIGAKPGRIDHPDFFRERHDLADPDQTDLGDWMEEPETLDELVEEIVKGNDPLLDDDQTRTLSQEA